MTVNKNTLYYLISAGIFILFKFIFIHASSDDLTYLLQPTNFIIETISNSNAQYLPNQGYYNKDLNILIDKSCSGFNFLMLCYLMLVFFIIDKLKNRTIKIISLPLLLLVSYILTIFINSSRIMLSILIHKLELHFLFDNTNWLHQLQGGFVYLFFLIIIYLTLEFIFKTTKLR